MPKKAGEKMAGKSNFIVRGGADFSNLYQGFTTAQKRLTSFQTGITKTLKGIGAILGSLAIGKLIKDSTSMAMGVESSIDNISRNMEGSAKAFQGWINTQSKALGMGKAEAYQYGATFSNLLSSFLGSAQQTADSTEDLMRASAIISSKTGRTFDDVSNRIRSGMLGSTEAIEDLGVYVQVSMLESTEAFRKFANGKSWAQLDYQTQQQIRLQAILEQAYKRYGDTLADTTQTRQAQFLASLKNIQLSLGQAFLPIYNAVLPGLTAMADAIGRVVSVIAQFTQALFGKPKQQATATQQQTQAVTQQSGAVTDLGDAYKKAGKKAKGALAGFDEVNQLTKDTGSDKTSTPATGGVATVPGIGTNEEIGTGITISPAIEKAISGLKNAIKPAIDALGELKEALAPFAANVGEGLLWLWNNVLVPFGTWTMNEVVPAFLKILSGAISIVNEVIEALKPLGQWLWDKFLEPLAKWTGGIIIDVLKKIGDGLSNIGDWIKNHKSAVEIMAIVVGSFAAAWALVNAAIGIWNIIGAIATGVTAAFGAAVAFLTSPITLVVLAIGALIAIIVLLVRHWDDVKKAAETAWNWIVDVWNKAGEWFNTAVIQPIANFFTGLWNSIKTNASESWTAIENAFKTAGVWFNNSVILPIKTFFAGLWDGIKTGASEAWSTVSGAFSSAWKWFVDNVTKPIGQAFTEAWEGIKKAFTSTFDFIKNRIKTYMNGCIGIVEGFVNGFIKGINFIIKAINKIKINVPSWLEKISGMKSIGFNIGTVSDIRIPRLATGGITDGPTLAMVGDNPGGREVVSPLDDLMGMIREAVQSNGGGNNLPIQLIVNVGGDTLVDRVISGVNRQNRKSGKTVITI